MTIDRIGSPPLAAPATTGTTAGKGVDGAGFGGALKHALGAVESSSADANQAIGRMLEGTGDVHEAVLAVQRADTMLQLTVQIRNKIVQAYQDVMRMPV